MLDIILPIGGSLFFPAPNDDIPVILKNVDGKPILYWAMQHLERIEGEKRYILVGEKASIDRYNIPNIIKFYTDCEIEVVSLEYPTQGAACSVLMTIDKIKSGREVLLSSLDQYLAHDITPDIEKLRSVGASAGIWCFDSVHPKWSYARLDNDYVIEVREKMPISMNALTSLYWFSNSEVLFDAIMDSIRRGNKTNNQFYLAPCLNELVLRSQPVKATKVDAEDYYNFYDMQQILAFGNDSSKDLVLEKATKAYASAFNAKDLSAVAVMFHPDITLMDSFTSTITGKSVVEKFVGGLFENTSDLNFAPTRISRIDANTTSIEFSLTLDGDTFHGVDVITWTNGLIFDLKAYLHKAHEV